VASAAEAVRAQQDALAALASRHGGRMAALDVGAWGRLAGALEGPVVVRLAGEPARLGHWLAALTAAARDGGVELTSLGDAGGGMLRALLRAPQGDGLPAADWLSGAVSGLRAALAAEGGSLVVERAPRALKDTVDVWGPVAPEALAIMRRLKAEFDPGGVLNPGRFVGGL
jgi:glycolate oxidase FAD binding subunit